MPASHLVAHVRSARPREGLTRWASSKKRYTETLQEPTDLGDGIVIRQVAPERQTWKPCPVGLHGFDIGVHANHNVEPGCFEPEAQTTRATEEVRRQMTIERRN